MDFEDFVQFVREQGLDPVIVRHIYGGGDDSYKKRDREIVSSYQFEWEDFGRSRCMRIIYACTPMD